MRLTVVGCSGSVPGPAGPASCYLLEADGFRLVIDLGNGALGALQRHASLDSIDAVCLSHLHSDHCLDLCPYWVARTFAPGGVRPPLPVYGPRDTRQRMTRANGLEDDSPITERFVFRALEPGTRELGPFRVTLAHMNHPVETFGFRIEHAGESLAYSADTGLSEALVELARGAGLLLCEATFLTEPDLPEDLHLTARQAVQHAAQAGAGRLVLTHVPPWNDPVRVLEEAASVPFAGDVSLAAAGQTYNLA